MQHTHTQSKSLNYENCRNAFNKISSVTPHSVQKSKSHSCTRDSIDKNMIMISMFGNVYWEWSHFRHCWPCKCSLCFLDVVDRPWYIWCCLIDQAPSGKILLNDRPNSTCDPQGLQWLQKPRLNGKS